MAPSQRLSDAIRGEIMKPTIFNRFFLMAILSLALAAVMFYVGYCKIFGHPSSPFVGPIEAVLAIILVIVGRGVTKRSNRD